MTEPTENQPRVFDREELLAEVEGDCEFVEELVCRFAASSIVRMKGIEEAVRSGDSKGLANAAHALRGAAANLRAFSVADAANRLEMIGKNGNLGSAPAALSDLRDRMAVLMERLSPFFCQSA